MNKSIGDILTLSNRFPAFTVVLCLLFFSVNDVNAEAFDTTPAMQWLEKMQQAMKASSYQGTVAFMKNNSLETMKYSHHLLDGAEEERLISLNSPMREVTRHAGEVSCIYKESNEKVVNHHPIDHSLIFSLPDNLANIAAHYQFDLDGQEAIAMRMAQLLRIKPHDDLRYSRAIWIDKQHFLPLKIEVYGSKGEVLEQVVFTDIDIDVSKPDAPRIAEDGNTRVKHIHSSRAEPLENASFVLANWPSGFQPVFFIRNSIHDSEQAIDHLMLTDGLSSISVYLEASGANALKGLHSLGAVNSYSRIVANKQVTVLGEVPAKTVESVAAGVSLR